MGTGLSLGAALGMGATAHAADFTVTNDLDTGDGSLRKAIADSEAAAGPDRILFQSGLTGSVTSSSTLDITQALEILGPGAGAFTASGNDAERVINIDTAVGADVLISGLNLIDGHSTSDGGVISSVDADLTIQSSTISGGTAEIGAGVYSNLGTTTIYDSTISGNDATEAGGGVYSLDADLQIKGSTIAGNGAPFGAGIHAKNEDTFLHSSTISGNTATEFGGGVWADGGTLAIYSSTISGNAADYGGGVTAAGHDPDPGVFNSIVANNTANSELDLRDAGGDPFRVAFSLVESPAGGSIIDFIPGSNLLSVDPQLGPLAGNGGPTQTLRPALTSPAVDKGASGGTPTDQRGLPRAFDVPSIANSPVPLMGPAGTDMGAVELQAADFATTASPPPPPPPQAKKSCKKKKKGKKRAASAKCKKKKRKK